MSAETTRRTMEPYIHALLSSGDYARFLDEDVMLTFMGTDRAVSGRDAVREFITFVHTQAFETDIKVKRLVCGDGEAFVEAEFVGTHIAAFEGVPASHRPVRVPYAAAYDVKDTGITALRLYFPLDQLMRQIGAQEMVAESA